MLIYKNKAHREKNVIYNIWADEFQKLAVHILDKFYSIHPTECIKAIIREIPQFGNVTWLHLAVMAEAKYFIAQRAVQDVLNDIWYVQSLNRSKSTSIDEICLIGMDGLIIVLEII